MSENGTSLPAITSTGSSGMKASPSNSSLLGGSRSSAPITRNGNGSGHGGPTSRLSAQMFMASGPVTTGAYQSVEDYRTRKVALITGA